MREEIFNIKIQELILEIAKLPEEKRHELLQLVEETKRRQESLSKNADHIAQSIADLRTSLKYLFFDLEATKRERDSLRQSLDTKGYREDNDDLGKAEGTM